MEQKQTRYSFIDGLRGFAALWVVSYHLWNRFYPGLSTHSHPLTAGIPDAPLAALNFFGFGLGYSAVTLFFVLSGLCIHLPQAKQGSGYVLPIDFAARRFWRLYPAYAASIAFAVLALAMPKLLLVISGRSFHEFEWWNELRVTDSFINLGFLQQFWPKSLELNGVYWTLLYEVQFYMAYPALLWCLRNSNLAIVGLILFLFEIYFDLFPSSIIHFFPGKYFEWFLGVLAAEIISKPHAWFSNRVAAVCFALGLGAGVYSIFNPVVYPFRDTLLAIGFFGLVLLIARGSYLPLKIFNGRALVTIGIFSYSVYLIHIPLIDLIWVGIDRLVVPRFSNPEVVQVGALVCIPVILAASYVFYVLFERPFIRSKKRIQQQGVPKPAVARPLLEN